jgi:hypothetical protein
LRAKIVRGRSYASILVIPQKNELVWGSPWEAAMARVEAPWELIGISLERKGKGERDRRCPWGAAREAGASGWLPVALLVREGRKERSVWWLLVAWEENRWKEKRREEREKKRRRGKRRKKERNFFSNLEISEKIKDTLWSWSKIIFVEERYLPNYK